MTPLPDAEPARPRPRYPRGRLVITADEPEPRVFTLLWSFYLLGAAATTIFSVQPLGSYDPALYRPAGRILLGMVGLGVGVLWPMVRLSQASPAHPRGSAASDVVALLAPAQAVLWPLTVLGGWSWGVTAGFVIGLAGWVGVMGALLSIAIAGRSRLRRVGWMAVCLGLVIAGPVIGWTQVRAGAAPSPVHWLMTSPLTLGWGVTDAPPGTRPRMTDAKWVFAIAPVLVALALWALAGAVSRSRPVSPAHRG